LPLNTNELHIIKLLLDKKTALNLAQIQIELSFLSLQKRVYNTLLKSLIDSNRLYKNNNASLTTYLLKEPLSAYQRYDNAYVYKGGILCGILIDTQESFTFIYDNLYLSRELEEIPTLPLSIEAIESSSLHPIFDENLLEGINDEIANIKSQSASVLDKLVNLKKNIGDLYFSRSNKEVSFSKNDTGYAYSMKKNEILGTNIFPEILNYELELSDDVLFPYDKDLSIYVNDETQGISGFQYKKIVTIEDEAERVYLSEGVDDHTQYILKPLSKIKSTPTNTNYLPHLAINEHLFMTFAKNELEFDVPRSCLIKKDGDEEYHYAVKRFDRYGTQRYSKVNFSSYLGLTRETKCETTSEKMFERMAKVIQSPKERLVLLKYYFYSIMIVHEDMHTKNISLITSAKTIVMSPLYDIACTGIYQFCKKYETAIMLNGKKNNIKPNDMKILIKICKLDHKEVIKKLKEMVKVYETVFPKYIKLVSKHFPDSKVVRFKSFVRNGIQDFKPTDESIPFAEVFAKQYKERMASLEKYEWLD